MRGVGKTQAAAAYARECVAARWRLVAWVDAETGASTLEALAEAATAAGVGLPEDDQAGIARALRRWLEADGHGCLLVFDNASDPDQLRPYLPAVGAAQVVITSTRRSMSGLGISVPVGVFTESEALSYLAERTGRGDTRDAGEVAAELGYLPLALAQAAAVIAAQQLSYPAYLARLRAIPVGQYLQRPEDDPYPDAVAATIVVSFGDACARDATGLARFLMTLIALLSPAGVPRTLLHAAARAGASHETRRGRQDEEQAGRCGPAEADAALAHLAGASLLTFNLDGSVVSAHRLTTRVIREHGRHDSTLLTVSITAVAVLQSATSSLEPVLRHAHAARDLARQITALSAHLATAPGGMTEDLLQLRGWALQCLTGLGDAPAQAISLGEALAADCQRLAGDRHPRTMSVRNDLANAYRQAGLLDQAIALHERNLADREQILGASHHDTLASRNNLAGAYESAGRLDEAVPLAERVLADRERTLGTRHPSTLAARNNLAYKYELAGRADEAIALFERVLAEREQVLGTDDPRTLMSRNGLARACQNAGQLDQAITLYQDTLADRERTLGPDHPQTMTSRHGLAIACRLAGRFGQAIELLENTLAGREKILGPEHPRTLITRHDLATAYQQAGRNREAIPLLEQALADAEKSNGPDHPGTQAIRDTLTSLQQSAE
jgi:tetratricopeptide (TPR) repeat protein